MNRQPARRHGEIRSHRSMIRILPARILRYEAGAPADRWPDWAFPGVLARFVIEAARIGDPPTGNFCISLAAALGD